MKAFKLFKAWLDSKYAYYTMGALFFIFATICLSLYCYGASVYGDEYFSMGFANNTEDFLFLSQGAIDIYGENGWIDGNFIHDYLSVQPGEQFSIMSIHRNVRADVHPPLYFMLLNVISSFFTDKVTLFPGYLINVVSCVCICVFLFLISKKVFTNKWSAYFPPLFWLMSRGANITVTYLRMYAPLGALVLVCMYLHIIFLEKEKPRLWLYILLGICTTVGTLTHYYFYLFLFMLFMITIITLLFHKETRKLIFYGVSLFLGEIISVMAYPYVFRHLLFSERGTQVRENFVNYDWNYYIEFIKEFMVTFNDFIFNENFDCFTGIIGVLLLVSSLKMIVLKDYRRRLTFKRINNRTTNFFVILIVAIGYFLILLKISYSSRWLYISPVFSLFAIISMGVIISLLSNITKKYYAPIILICLVVTVLTFCIPSMQNSLIEHRRIEKRHQDIVTYSPNCDVLFLYYEWNNLYDNQLLEIQNFNQIKAESIDKIDNGDFKSIIETRKKNNNNLIVYLPENVENREKIVSTISNQVGGKKPVLVDEQENSIYFIKIESDTF